MRPRSGQIFRTSAESRTDPSVGPSRGERLAGDCADWSGRRAAVQDRDRLRFQNRHDYTQRIVTPRGELASDEVATVELFEKVSPSVVYVRMKSTGRTAGHWRRHLGAGNRFRDGIRLGRERPHRDESACRARRVAQAGSRDGSAAGGIVEHHKSTGVCGGVCRGGFQARYCRAENRRRTFVAGADYDRLIRRFEGGANGPGDRQSVRL